MGKRITKLQARNSMTLGERSILVHGKRRSIEWLKLNHPEVYKKLEKAGYIENKEFVN